MMTSGLLALGTPYILPFDPGKTCKTPCLPVPSASWVTEAMSESLLPGVIMPGRRRKDWGAGEAIAEPLPPAGIKPRRGHFRIAVDAHCPGIHGRGMSSV